MFLLLSSQQALQVINHYGVPAGKKKDQEEIGLEDVLRLLKMELHCNARRIWYKNMQLSNLFFCSEHILGAFSSLAKILVFILNFYDVILKLHCEFLSYLTLVQNHLDMIEPSLLGAAMSGNGFIHMK